VHLNRAVLHELRHLWRGLKAAELNMHVLISFSFSMYETPGIGAMRRIRDSVDSETLSSSL
jgi:hypothetical protein